MLFVMKKLITPLLLPPGLFVLILLVAGIVQLRGRNRAGGVFCLLLAVLLWGISTVPVADGLLHRLEKGQAIPAKLDGDVIVLLGAGVYGGAPDLTGRGTPSDEMLARVVTAVRAQRRLGVPVIVSGGVVFSGMAAEAPIVRRFLVDLGVPQQKVIVEDRSRDTAGNARFTREICARHGFRNPLLVTSAYHMPRSLLAFRNEGMAVTPLPAQFHTWQPRQRLWTDWLPDAGSLRQSAAALREQLGLIFYRLAGSAS